ncbi:GGDEF domain-containing protein [Rhizobium sp. AAP116]|uniref:GGDEF domain-containing protein n=1 Tax=Rhizobium sp. AAP116 TaxID=1523429 RepID=UPI0006B99EFC|nr:GGDEF domain-containing protein [Rhizobium sp. AAP116]
MSRGSKWLWRQVDVGALDSAGAVRRFALSVGFRAVIVTSLAGLVLLPLLYVLNVVATPIDQTMRLMVAFSWLFGGVLSAACAFVAGHVLRELLLSRRKFERLSRTDTLSGLANRRAFNEASLAIDRDASLAIIDIDRFKTINDRYGHQTGDRVIQSISSLLKEVFGEAHLVARLGGEEFGVIIRGGSVAERLALVEQARRRVAAETILFQDAELHVTVSAGVAEFTPGKRPESVYAWADKALYLAKESGRDCVFHENSLALVEAFSADHAPDDAQLFAAIGRRG